MNNGNHFVVMQTSKQKYRVDRRQISFIKFIFEAYEGVAVVTTLDPATGLISLAMAPGCEKLVRDVMDDLSRSILIEPIDHTNIPTIDLTAIL
jgi:hypothetical protein